LVAWSTPTNISISTINENSNSNGATIANGVIKLSPADAINGGIVTTGNQTFSGNKIVVGNLETQTSLDTPVKDINANNPTSPVGAPDQEARQSFTAGISGYLSNIKIKLFSSGTYTISIYKGGNIMSENNPGGIQLFQTTFTSINNVMSSIPITNTPITAGDIYWIKISGTSLNIGLNWGQSNVGTTVSFPAYRGGISQSWIFETYVSQLIGGNITVAGSIISSGFKTPSGTSSQYLMADGSVTNVSSGSTSASVDLITNQTIAGTKTFNSDIKVNGLTIGKGIGQVNDQNITIGDNTLTNNTTGQHLIALGGSTLQSNTSANYNIGIGSSALSGNSTGENNIAIGAAALAFNNGSNNTAVGLSASLLGSANSNVTSLGYQAGMLNTGSSNTFIGASTDQTTASTSITNSTAIGYGAKISAANQIQLGNTSVINVKTSGSYTGSGFKTPTGTSSQYLMADGSVSSGSSGSTIASVDLTTNQTIAGSKTFSSDLNVSGLTIGGTSNTTILGANASGGPFSTTIGNNASSPSSYSVAIGRYSNAMSSYSMAIGGLAAKASESYSLAIGGNAPEATGVYSTAIGGSLPKATALQSTALGSSTTASGQNSTALGYGATVSSDNTIQLGNTSVTDVKTSGSLTAKSIISFGKMVMSTATIEYSQLNNYDVSNVSILFVKPNSTWTNIYGLSGGTIGQIIHIYSVNNQTSNCCTALSLWNYDSSSNTGIQKFVAPGGINIGSNEDTTLVFDGTYWRVSNFGM